MSDLLRQWMTPEAYERMVWACINLDSQGESEYCGAVSAPGRGPSPPAVPT